jgi:secreted protein with Ig-like and vWFA domain
LCLAEHLFFVQTPKAELPHLAIPSFGLLAIDDSLLNPAALTALIRRSGVDSGPPLSAHARRSALCVYRI